MIIFLLVVVILAICFPRAVAWCIGAILGLGIMATVLGVIGLVLWVLFHPDRG